ncbi:aminoglycoside N(3)-acetyltransferase [Micromonosporaceae bacterium Da 78-11]
MDYATRESLAAQLRTLGISSGDVLLMHSSYKSLGFVVGGPQAVVQALLDTLGPGGTLVVPTHTPDNSDPAHWAHPPVPRAWWEPIRRQAPGFDVMRTPAGRHMGRLAELVRTWPGALRSDHPQVSFAAVGARAAEIVSDHQLEDGLGERSPLGALYRLDGRVLLLGCGHTSNTSLHLAEVRRPSPPQHTTGSSIRLPGDGPGRWMTWSEVDVDSGDFASLGADLEATSVTTTGPVAATTARLMRQRAAVDFATSWIPAHRPDWN